MNYKFWICQSQAYSLLGIPLSKVLMTMAVSRDFYLSSYTVADPPASQAVFDHAWRVASPHPTPHNKRTDSSRAQPLFNAVRMRRSKGSYIRTRYVKSPHPERVPHLWWKLKLFHGFATFGTYALVTVYISPELYNPWTWNLYCWTQLAKMDVLKCCSNLMRWGCHHAWTWAYEYLPFLFHGPSYVWVGVVLCLL